MAWGVDCSLWDDSVDHADLERFGYSDIPEDEFVMTTWHEGDTLEEVFWFARHVATQTYDDRSLERLLVLDLGPVERSATIAALYAEQ